MDSFDSYKNSRGKPMKRHFLFVLLIGLLSMLAYFSYRQVRAPKIKWTDVSKTKLLVSEIYRAIIEKEKIEPTILEKTNAFANGDIDKANEYLRSHLRIEDRFLPRKAPQNVFVDFWGQPLKFRLNRMDEKFSVKIYSVGANGLDENGNGDDV